MVMIDPSLDSSKNVFSCFIGPIQMFNKKEISFRGSRGAPSSQLALIKRLDFRAKLLKNHFSPDRPSKLAHSRRWLLKLID